MGKELTSKTNTTSQDTPSSYANHFYAQEKTIEGNNNAMIIFSQLLPNWYKKELIETDLLYFDEVQKTFSTKAANIDALFSIGAEKIESGDDPDEVTKWIHSFILTDEQYQLKKQREERLQTLEVQRVETRENPLKETIQELMAADHGVTIRSIREKYFTTASDNQLIDSIMNVSSLSELIFPMIKEEQAPEQIKFFKNLTEYEAGKKTDNERKNDRNKREKETFKSGRQKITTTEQLKTVLISLAQDYGSITERVFNHHYQLDEIKLSDSLINSWNSAYQAEIETYRAIREERTKIKSVTRATPIKLESLVQKQEEQKIESKSIPKQSPYRMPLFAGAAATFAFAVGYIANAFLGTQNISHLEQKVAMTVNQMNNAVLVSAAAHTEEETSILIVQKPTTLPAMPIIPQGTPKTLGSVGTESGVITHNPESRSQSNIEIRAEQNKKTVITFAPQELSQLITNETKATITLQDIYQSAYTKADLIAAKKYKRSNANFAAERAKEAHNLPRQLAIVQVPSYSSSNKHTKRIGIDVLGAMESVAKNYQGRATVIATYDKTQGYIFNSEFTTATAEILEKQTNKRFAKKTGAKKREEFAVVITNPIQTQTAQYEELHSKEEARAEIELDETDLEEITTTAVTIAIHYNKISPPALPQSQGASKKYNPVTNDDNNKSHNSIWLKESDLEEITDEKIIYQLPPPLPVISPSNSYDKKVPYFEKNKQEEVWLNQDDLKEIQEEITPPPLPIKKILNEKIKSDYERREQETEVWLKSYDLEEISITSPVQFSPPPLPKELLKEKIILLDDRDIMEIRVVPPPLPPQAYQNLKKEQQ